MTDAQVKGFGNPECGECGLRHPIGQSCPDFSVNIPGVLDVQSAADALAVAYREEGEANDALNAAIKKRREAALALDEAKRKAAEAVPVDRNARTLADGSPVTADHRDLRPDGQQKGYVVLSDAERAKGFVRPVRRSYTHLKCGGMTTMGQTIAETYARDPGFYSGTFCCHCGSHYPVGENGEFVWFGTEEKVGT